MLSRHRLWLAYYALVTRLLAQAMTHKEKRKKRLCRSGYFLVFGHKLVTLRRFFDFSNLLPRKNINDICDFHHSVQFGYLLACGSL